MELHKLLEGNKPILLDGGMGTMLQAKGLKPGEPPELAALTHPDWLLDKQSVSGESSIFS